MKRILENLAVRLLGLCMVVAPRHTVRGAGLTKSRQPNGRLKLLDEAD